MINCPHSEAGWCTSCVARLADRQRYLISCLHELDATVNAKYTQPQLLVNRIKATVENQIFSLKRQDRVNPLPPDVSAMPVAACRTHAEWPAFTAWLISTHRWMDGWRWEAAEEVWRPYWSCWLACVDVEVSV